MAIDRAGRAERRWKRREAERVRQHESVRGRLGAAGLEVAGLVDSGARLQREQLAWVAVAKEDERESGDEPLDLDSGVARLRRR
ncbi:hypothetical protein IQ251_10820 [Saccharopolyspora sp. HNM0983]|uniref:Uncharacterized protein n=1 Tax=Saccharopolyspora montiporae TaxID=2781240 RepID=A0A929BAR6_9PSEU|nr:hypothetical protein [Saccharopolyspora sp. HNM0983]MBE9374935.1 hypothetical protein [Saccharopolyspora sp. HNM0983]